jgi:hypothetical protein
MKVRPPNRVALEMIADGLESAIRMRSWDLVESYQFAVENLSKGLPAFGERAVAPDPEPNRQGGGR